MFFNSKYLWLCRIAFVCLILIANACTRNSRVQAVTLCSVNGTVDFECGILPFLPCTNISQALAYSKSLNDTTTIEIESCGGVYHDGDITIGRGFDIYIRSRIIPSVLELNYRKGFILESCSLHIDGWHVQNGSSSQGAAIYAKDSRIVIKNSTFLHNLVEEANRDAAGGAIFAEDSNITIVSSSFEDNACAPTYTGTYLGTYGGAVYSFAQTKTASVLDIESSTFVGNGMVISAKGGKAYGGAVAAKFVHILVKNSVFIDNTAICQTSDTWSSRYRCSAFGGALYINSPLSTLFENSRFYGNSANTNGGLASISEGGGIYIYVRSKISIVASKFEQNSAHSESKGSQNVESHGGAIYYSGYRNVGDSLFISSHFENNQATAVKTSYNIGVYSMGGALYFDTKYSQYHELLFDKCNFTNNQANAITTHRNKIDLLLKSQGGGVYVYESFNMNSKTIFNSCTVSGNSASLSSPLSSKMGGNLASGGGIYVYAFKCENNLYLFKQTSVYQNTVTIYNAIFTTSVEMDGGGIALNIFMGRNCSSIFRNCSLVENQILAERDTRYIPKTCTVSRGGGLWFGIELSPFSGIFVTNCEISQNRLSTFTMGTCLWPYGGGFYATIEGANTEARFENTSVSNNTISTLSKPTSALSVTQKGYGGGIAVDYSYRSHQESLVNNNTISLEFCEVNDNSVFLGDLVRIGEKMLAKGGGISVYYYALKASYNQLHLSHCSLSNNSIQLLTYGECTTPKLSTTYLTIGQGGALSMVYDGPISLAKKIQTLEHNRHLFSNCSVVNNSIGSYSCRENSGVIGGGLSLAFGDSPAIFPKMSTKGSETVFSNVSILFNEVVRLKGRLESWVAGGGVYYDSGSHSQYKFVNVTVLGNKAVIQGRDGRKCSAIGGAVAINAVKYFYPQGDSSDPLVGNSHIFDSCVFSHNIAKSFNGSESVAMGGAISYYSYGLNSVGRASDLFELSNCHFSENEIYSRATSAEITSAGCDVNSISSKAQGGAISVDFIQPASKLLFHANSCNFTFNFAFAESFSSSNSKNYLFASSSTGGGCFVHSEPYGITNFSSSYFEENRIRSTTYGNSAIQQRSVSEGGSICWKTGLELSTCNASLFMANSWILSSSAEAVSNMFSIVKGVSLFVTLSNSLSSIVSLTGSNIMNSSVKSFSSDSQSYGFGAAVRVEQFSDRSTIVSLYNMRVMHSMLQSHSKSAESFGYGAGMSFSSKYVSNSFQFIVSSRFENNEIDEKTKYAAARALMLQTISSPDCSFKVQLSQFINNKAASGGALSMNAEGGSGILLVQSCFFLDNKALIYDGGIISLSQYSNMDAWTVAISDTLFRHGFAFARGGAIFSENLHKIDLKNCQFDDNKAMTSGGAIFAQRSRISVQKCGFERNTANVGEIMFLKSETETNISNCIVEIRDAEDIFHLADSSSLSMPPSELSCPVGTHLSVTELEWSCKYCQKSEYNVLANTGCLPCPSNGGAICYGKDQIYSVSGYQLFLQPDKGELLALLCPAGYCFEGVSPVFALDSAKCLWNESCAQGRNISYPFCGKCLDGYTETFGSRLCVSEMGCGGAVSWLFFAGLCTLLVLYVLYQLHSRRRSASGILKSVLYFGQTVDLIGEERIDSLASVKELLVSGPNLSPGIASVCLFPMSSKAKLLFAFAPVFLMFLVLLIFYFAYRILKVARHKISSKKASDVNLLDFTVVDSSDEMISETTQDMQNHNDWNSRFIIASVSLSLAGYSTILKATSKPQ